MDEMEIYQRCEKAIEGYAQQTNVLPPKENQDGISWGVQWADKHKIPNAKAKAFYELVKEMRTAQLCYFKTRSQDWLRKSKALEDRVDTIIRETEEKLQGQQQINFKSE